MYTLTIASRMVFLPKITVIMYKMMALFDIKSPYVEADFIGLIRMKASNSKKNPPQFFEDDLRFDSVLWSALWISQFMRKLGM